MSEDNKAVVLVSGGLDSATVLAMAQAEGYTCYTLSFDYGQRHRAELQAAERISLASKAVEHRVIRFDLGLIGGSALTDMEIAVPEAPTEGIPITYVPARNTIFLSFALGYAEVVDADQAYVQAELTGTHTWVCLPPDQVRAAHKAKFRRPVYRLKNTLYGHPDSRTMWEESASPQRQATMRTAMPTCKAKERSS